MQIGTSLAANPLGPMAILEGRAKPTTAPLVKDDQPSDYTQYQEGMRDLYKIGAELQGMLKDTVSRAEAGNAIADDKARDRNYDKPKPGKSQAEAFEKLDQAITDLKSRLPDRARSGPVTELQNESPVDTMKKAAAKGGDVAQLRETAQAITAQFAASYSPGALMSAYA